eukprot:12415585-Karenia_brevis.AAC.1
MMWARGKVASRPPSAGLDACGEHSAFEQKLGESWSLEQFVINAVNQHGWANYMCKICLLQRSARAQD